MSGTNGYRGPADSDGKGQGHLPDNVNYKLGFDDALYELNKIAKHLHSIRADIAPHNKALMSYLMHRAQVEQSIEEAHQTFEAIKSLTAVLFILDRDY